MCGGKFVKRGSLSLSFSFALSFLLTKEQRQVDLICSCAYARTQPTAVPISVGQCHYFFSDRDSHSMHPVAWLVPIRQPVTFPWVPRPQRFPSESDVCDCSRLGGLFWMRRENKRTERRRPDNVISRILPRRLWKEHIIPLSECLLRVHPSSHKHCLPTSPCLPQRSESILWTHCVIRKTLIV